MDLKLVPIQTLEAVEAELDRRIATLNEGYWIDPRDETYGKEFKYYLLFTHWPFLVPGDVGGKEIFYNRYYWG
jgi:hypothetical protein